MAQKSVWEGEHERAFEYLDEFMSAARALNDQGSSEDVEVSPILAKEECITRLITKESILFRLSWNAFNPIRKDARFIEYVREVEGWD